MSKPTRSVIACPPDRPVLHAGEEINWLLECAIQRPEERTTWAALTDALEESSWTHEEAVRCVRRCRRWCVRCQCVARAVKLLSVGARGRGYRLACDLMIERDGYDSRTLPIVVLHGPMEPRVDYLVRLFDPAPGSCVTVGERWIRSLMWTERFGTGRWLGRQWYGDPIPPAAERAIRRVRGARRPRVR